MEYIANIITKSKMEVSSFFNVTSDFESVNKNIPTLIIGWSETKQLFPEQDILEHKISDNIYWTFSKREKRYKYEIDLTTFINRTVEDIEKKVNYRFFNYVLSPQSKRDSFVEYVKKGNCSLYYNSRFLYVYSINDSITFGISLIDLMYVGINTRNFIQSLIDDNNNIICENLKCIDNESFQLIKENTKNIAYLNYLKNADIYKKIDNYGEKYQEALPCT